LENHGPWYYEQQYLGYNYRMTDIQAALGISQLKKSDKFLQLRRDYAKLYTEAFKSVDAFVYLKVVEELKERRIGVNVHYIPVYYHPFYRKYERIITLPLFPKMEKEDILYVISNVKDVIQKHII